jgi:hypothetical protein
MFIRSATITLDLYETPYNGRLIQAYLIRNGDSYFLELEITRDSASQDLKPICFKKGDRVSFSLSNHTNLTLIQTEDKICGIKTKNEKNDFVTVTNYIKVVITQDAYEKLSKNSAVLMRVSSKDYNETVVLKSEIEEITDDEITISNPSQFFIKNIKCLIEPDF